MIYVRERLVVAAESGDAIATVPPKAYNEHTEISLYLSLAETKDDFDRAVTVDLKR